MPISAPWRAGRIASAIRGGGSLTGVLIGYLRDPRELMSEGCARSPLLCGPGTTVANGRPTSQKYATTNVLWRIVRRDCITGNSGEGSGDSALFGVVAAGKVAGQQDGAVSLWLGVNADGQLVLRQEREEDSEGLAWALRRGDIHGGGPSTAPPTSSLAPGAGDTEGDMQRDGYVVLPGLIGRTKIDKALRFMNNHLGSADLPTDLEPDGLGMEFVRAMSRIGDGAEMGSGGEEELPPRGIVKLGGGRRCMCCLSQAPHLLAMMGPEVRRAAAKALAANGFADEAGRPPIISSTFGCQVALRFPLPPFAEGVVDGEAALDELMGHKGGLDWHTDAAKYNEKKTFDVVAGVFLNDLRTADQGVLWVQPGTHTAERAARESLGGRLPPGKLFTAAEDVKAAGRGTPILGPAGTVVLFDKDLVHAGGPNLSPGIRYALYYRLRLERPAAGKGTTDRV